MKPCSCGHYHCPICHNQLDAQLYCDMCNVQFTQDELVTNVKSQDLWDILA